MFFVRSQFYYFQMRFCPRSKTKNPNESGKQLAEFLSKSVDI